VFEKGTVLENIRINIRTKLKAFLNLNFSTPPYYKIIAKHFKILLFSIKEPQDYVGINVFANKNLLRTKPLPLAI
jgi:hypothetical protein